MLERIQNINKLLAGNPAWYGTKPLSDTTTEWEVIQWEKALGLYVPPYVPTFRRATGTDGMITWPLNYVFFATQETAQKMADLYGTGSVTAVPFGGNGGIFSADQEEFHITLQDGRNVNAGLIAGYYERNPQPGLADKLIRQVLGLDKVIEAVKPVEGVA